MTASSEALLLPARKRDKRLIARRVLVAILASTVLLGTYQQPAAAAPKESPAPARAATAASALATLTPLAQYRIDSLDRLDYLGNSITANPAAAAHGGAAFAEDEQWQPPQPRSVGLDGRTAYVDTPIALDTTASFTVSTWLHLTTLGSAQTVIAQNGARVSSFRIGVTSAGKWQMVMPRTDTDAATADTVTGPAAGTAKWSEPEVCRGLTGDR